METDLYGTYLSFLQENPILRSHLRSVRALTVTPNSFRIISVTMSICHEPVSKPHFFGLLLSRRRTVRMIWRGSLALRPLGLALNLPFSPRSRIRSSQSRIVE